MILDPTAPPAANDADPGPALEDVAGRVAGIRLDRAWRSFEWVADEWSRSFVELGARATRWVAGNRIGEEGDRTRRELATFAAGVDFAVVGLGN
jgi:hypothetical protein